MVKVFFDASLADYHGPAHKGGMPASFPESFYSSNRAITEPVQRVQSAAEADIIVSYTAIPVHYRDRPDDDWVVEWKQTGVRHALNRVTCVFVEKD